MIHELETQIKLYINKRLYERGLITEELYNKAKELLQWTCLTSAAN